MKLSYFKKSIISFFLFLLLAPSVVILTPHALAQTEDTSSSEKASRSAAGLRDKVNDKKNIIFGKGVSNVLDVGVALTIPLATCGISYGTGVLLSKLEVGTAAVPTSGGGATATVVKDCLDQVGVSFARLVLKKVTASTVNWINSGFQGDPLFVQNPGSFLKSIGDEQYNQFISSIGYDPNLFPFGRLTARNLQNYLGGYFERNAQYSLDKYLYDGATFVQYNNNFSLGGWDAYINLAEPSNNPIGFQIVAQDTLAKRMAGAFISKADEVRNELNQGQGFLSLKTCVEPVGFQEDKAARNAALEKLSTANNELYKAREAKDTNAIDKAQQVVDKAQAELASTSCQRYETATPGQVIADQARISLGKGPNALLLANDLQSSIAAITDALLNQLVQKGLRSLNPKEDDSIKTPGSGTVEIFGAYGNNTPTYNPQFTPDEGDSLGDFDIQADLPGIITRHELYRDEILSKQDILTSLIQNIYQLDFCIPGPNPLWESNIQSRFKEISDEVTKINNENTDSKLEVNKELLRQFTNITAQTATTEDKAKIDTAQKLNAVLARILEQYKPVIKTKFSGSKLPSSSSLNKVEFNNISTYKNDLLQLEDDLESLDLLIQRLRILNDQAQSATTQAQLDNLTETFYSYIIDIVEESTLKRQQENNVFLNQKISRIITATNTCESDLSSNSNLAQERISYPSDLKRPDGAKDFGAQTSFLREYIYGNGQGSTIRITDLITIDINSDLSTFEKVFGVY